MTRSNHFRFMMLLVLVSGILIIPAMATTLDIEDATFANIGDTQVVEITLDGATNGPGGYILQLEVEDPTIAEIIAVEFRTWANLNGTSSLPSTEPVLMAAELSITDYAAWGYIANVSVRAKKAGTTNLTIKGTPKILYDDGTPVNPTVIEGILNVTAPPDITPPGSITNLTNTTQQTSIIWTWTDPLDLDFDYVEVYLNGTFKVNVDKGIKSYFVDQLLPSSSHEIATRTVDTWGNVNATWVNQTATTNALPVPDTTPPGSITNLTSTTQQTSITWNWDNPVDTDFAWVMVYFNGGWVENVTGDTKTFSALTPGIPHTIATKTVDTSGNVNATWVNQTATTQPPSGATGSLWISTSPRYATVSIDDVLQPGLTPNTYTAAAGNRKITITYGTLTKTTFVNVPANGQVRLNVIL